MPSPQPPINTKWLCIRLKFHVDEKGLVIPNIIHLCNWDECACLIPMDSEMAGPSRLKLGVLVEGMWENVLAKKFVWIRQHTPGSGARFNWLLKSSRKSSRISNEALTHHQKFMHMVKPNFSFMRIFRRPFLSIESETSREYWEGTFFAVLSWGFSWCFSWGFLWGFLWGFPKSIESGPRSVDHRGMGNLI